jgi:hypothetical protein
MYLAILDDQGRELAMGRVVLFDVLFRMSPGRNENEHCTIVNAVPITSASLTHGSAWAAALGLCEEVDSMPFVAVPLEHGRWLHVGEALGIAPGQLVLSWTLIRPGRKQDPDPSPKTPSDQAKSRV